jgi:hypothetical protein
VGVRQFFNDACDLNEDKLGKLGKLGGFATREL